MYTEITRLLPPECLKFNEPMKRHTTFKIGGPADLMVIPHNTEHIITAIKYAQASHIPLFVLGMGSNLLVRDKGIRGIVIKLGNSLTSVTINGNEMIAESGIRLSQLSREAMANSLSGLEFAEGIPGSLGGAIVMNAGAYDGQISDIVKEVTGLTTDGELLYFTKEKIQFNYRCSIFQQEKIIVLKARLELKPADKDTILNKMKEYAHRRREKQPLDYPSAGSIFKRPSGFYVGSLLEEMGLKGYTIGDAQVSAKHAGFIINTGNATAAQVIELIEHIKQKTRNIYGIELEPELKIIGEE